MFFCLSNLTITATTVCMYSSTFRVSRHTPIPYTLKTDNPSSCSYISHKKMTAPSSCSHRIRKDTTTPSVSWSFIARPPSIPKHEKMQPFILLLRLRRGTNWLPLQASLMHKAALSRDEHFQCCLRTKAFLRIKTPPPPDVNKMKTKKKTWKNDYWKRRKWKEKKHPFHFLSFTLILLYLRENFTIL